MPSILIIDDDELFSEMLAKVVEQMGNEAVCSHTIQSGLKTAKTFGPDVVFLDVRMPDGNGLDFIPRFQETASAPEVIIITGLGDSGGAEMAMLSGAWAYVQKGASLQDITLPLTRALQYRQEKALAKTPVTLKRDNIIGKSQRIKACLDLMAQGANSGANILIIGETGTGKELFARAIHENSPREKNNFVIVDCAALPETLVESVLFGHAKGAFTGADKIQDGLVLQAHQGTLFLDEIGELPLTVQKTFLRVLQEHEFRPVGSQKEVHSDFRLVAATNRNLEQMVDEGRFRRDLLYRLRGFVLDLPPLRDHIEDLRELTLYYLAKLCRRNDSGTKGLSPEFMESLTMYNWPGNVRELVNTIERALAASQNEPTIYNKHLPANIRIYVAQKSIKNVDEDTARIPTFPFDRPNSLPSLKEFRESLEKQYLNDLIKSNNGDVNQASKAAGISKSRLYDLLKKFQIERG